MNGSWYAMLFVLHIVALAAAFGPVIIYATLLRRGTQEGGTAVLETAAAVNKKVVTPALVATILIGFGLIGLSEAYAFEQAWVSASMTISLILLALAYFVLTPGLERLIKAPGNESAEDQESGRRKTLTGVRLATAFYQIGFLVIVWLMYTKPGLS